MGQLVYFFNHSRREYFSPVLKLGEIYSNIDVMTRILEHFINYWNGDQIEIVMANSLYKIDKSEYEEVNMKKGDIKMEQLVYFFNHSRKQYLDISLKLGELFKNRFIIEEILDFFINYWNGNQIEIIMGKAFSKLDRGEYKKVDWYPEVECIMRDIKDGCDGCIDESKDCFTPFPDNKGFLIFSLREGTSRSADNIKKEDQIYNSI